MTAALKNISTHSHTIWNLPVEIHAAGNTAATARQVEYLGKNVMKNIFFFFWSPLPESFEAQGGLEFQELAVVWHEAWKAVKRTRVEREARLTGQHVMREGVSRGGPGCRKGKEPQPGWGEKEIASRKTGSGIVIAFWRRDKHMKGQGTNLPCKKAKNRVFVDYKC